jgi:zinc transporter ZupT
MPKVFTRETETHTTAPEEIRLSLGYLRQWCGFIAGHEIPAPTFSRWCSRFSIRGVSSDEVDLSIAAGLTTCAMLHYAGVRNFAGETYNKLYPLALRRVQELCQVQT